MTRSGEIPGQAGNDERRAGNDERRAGKAGCSVSSNNIHMESSFQVRKGDFEGMLTALRERFPDSQVWNRSFGSLKREWAAHNALHALGFARKQTAHMDLNWPQHWLVRLGYAIVGTIVWPFIK